MDLKKSLMFTRNIDISCICRVVLQGASRSYLYFLKRSWSDIDWRVLGSITFVIFGLVVIGLAAIKMNDERVVKNNG